jgi:pimeloyl-ACP methyl ester carboxylesterase
MPGIAAAVVQCPFTDGLASLRTINPLVGARIAALALRDLAGARFAKPPVMVPIVGRPGELALMNAPDAYPAFLRLVPQDTSVPTTVAARITMTLLAYRPGRLAAKVGCPILFCVCGSDSVAPAGATLRMAARAPRGEINVYPYGHFDIYVDDAFARVVDDQLAFLDKHMKG